jgi:hypothetical protein
MKKKKPRNLAGQLQNKPHTRLMHNSIKSALSEMLQKLNPLNARLTMGLILHQEVVRSRSQSMVFGMRFIESYVHKVHMQGALERTNRLLDSSCFMYAIRST